MNTIPILWNHDASRPVGKLEGDVATFLPRTVTAEWMFQAGWQVLESEEVGGVTYITRAKIRELSVGPV